MTLLRDPLLLLLNLAWWVILIHVIMSWLINFQVLNLRQPVVWRVWNLLNRLLEPVFAQVRRVIPVFGGLDFAPLVVFLAIALLTDFVRRGGY